MFKPVPHSCATLAFVTVFLAGCAPATPPTELAIPSQLAATSRPSETPAPTRTPVRPTPTLALPDKVMDYLQGVRVTYANPFDGAPTIGWSLGSATVTDGALKVMGPLIVERMSPLAEKHGILLDFALGDNTGLAFSMDNGALGTDSLKRFGPAYVLGRLTSYENTPLPGASQSGKLALKKGSIYALLIAIAPGGGYTAVVWDPARAADAVVFHETIKSWSGLEWTFRITVFTGALTVDNYEEIEFDAIR